MKTLTRKRAKEFSMLHWREKVKNNGHSLSEKKLKNLGLDKLRFNCGYCKKYICTSSKTLKSCAKCPIRPKVEDYNALFKLGCAQDCHPFYEWNENHTRETAQAVLTLIEQS